MSDHSFTKADRLLKRSEFFRLSKYGKKLHSQHFIAIYCPGRRDQTRLGVTVSKKVGQSATRNRTKRLLREYFRLNRHNIKGTWDINIISKKAAAALTSQTVFSSLKNIFDRLSIKYDNKENSADPC